MKKEISLDARGLSCPLPQMMAKKAMNQLGTGIVEIFVDTGTARDNIRRLAEGAGWTVTVQEFSKSEFRVVLSK